MCRRGSSPEGSRGQIMILAVIVLAVGMLMLTPLLSQLATMLQKGGDEREQRMKVYADEAAVNRVIADLIRGADGVGTVYNTIQPGNPGRIFAITTSYTTPSVMVNDYTPVVTISLPGANQTKPASAQRYVDPGVVHPNLAQVPAGTGYLMRLYNVKAGILQINWAYSPAGVSRIGVWVGMPVDPGTGFPYPPGQVTAFPADPSILDTGNTGAGATNNLTSVITVDPTTDSSGGVYTMVFFSSGNTKTTASYALGGTGNTWINIKSYKDYIVTATVGGVGVSTYLRQVPGYSEPPAATRTVGDNYTFTWGTSLVSFITNQMFPYTWLSP